MGGKLLAEEERVTAIGLGLQGESFLKTADFCRKANNDGALDLRFDSPTLFLLAHGIELTLKAWLRLQGFNLKQMRALGHNLTKLYKAAKRSGLIFDETVQLNRFAAKSAEFHLSDTGLVTELERVKAISECRRSREYWHHVWLLGKLHDRPHVLRYHRTGLYRYPNIDFSIFCSLQLSSHITSIIAARLRTAP